MSKHASTESNCCRWVAVVIWWLVEYGSSWQAYTHLAVTTPWGVELNLRKTDSSRDARREEFSSEMVDGS